MTALLKMAISPIMAPLLPYWLYFRYRLSRIGGEWRIGRIQQRYRYEIKQKQWAGEKWTVIETAPKQSEQKNHV